jgi:nucleotide-binding universal stress UspA family protein
MAIKSILCPYSGEQNSAAALRYALKAAQHHDAWVTGALAHGPGYIERQFAPMVGEQILGLLREQSEGFYKAIQERFDKEVSAAGWAEKSEFAEFDDQEHQALSAFARGFDLVIIGEHSANLNESHISPHPDMLALQSGRPVLMIPDAYEGKELASHVLIAWDGKRAAARAVGEAMVMLEQKGKVTLLTVGEDAASNIDGVGGIRTLLTRHGIETDHLHHEKMSGGIGRHILQAVDEVSAELVVMGAYEHSKFSHELFGGPTTHVLKNTKVPVLLVH